MKLFKNLKEWIIKYPDSKAFANFDPNEIGYVETDERPYVVTIYNDDVTPMVYVFDILHSHFLMDEDMAYKTVMKIHNEGAAVVFRTDEKSAKWLVGCVVKDNEKHGQSLNCGASPDSDI